MRVMTTLLPSAPGTLETASAFLVTNTRPVRWQPKRVLSVVARACWQSPSTLVGAVGGGVRLPFASDKPWRCEFDPITAGDGECEELIAVEVQ